MFCIFNKQCNDSSVQSCVVDCRALNAPLHQLWKAFPLVWWICVCPRVTFRSAAVSGRGLQIIYPNYSTPIILSALTLCCEFVGVWLSCTCRFLVRLTHLWVLVVSWHGWPMSLSDCTAPGLKYSSAVSAAGFVTAGVDSWVTRAWGKYTVNE